MKEPVNFQPQTPDLGKGETAFLQGNYKAASQIFKRILNGNEEPDVKNTALFNLACTKLVTSGNEKEFQAAIQLLNQWKILKRPSVYCEDPRLLLPGFGKMSDFNTKERERCLKSKKTHQTLVKSQNQKIIKMEKRIKTLQHQISELESIDQEIQEKRKTQ